MHPSVYGRTHEPGAVKESSLAAMLLAPLLRMRCARFTCAAKRTLFSDITGKFDREPFAHRSTAGLSADRRDAPRESLLLRLGRIANANASR